ncbi:MAG: ABC transporter substrate-binding protein [Flavobacteriales bacterium]|nr:ABC transporter substrate-binding protein [Flavobacteriales bacterium]
MYKLLNVFVIIFSLFFISNASADVNAEGSKSFVEKLGKEVIETVSDERLSDNQRRTNFRYLYLNSFDNFYISRFVLGRYWKRIDKSVKEEFVKTFNDYIVSTYAPKFKGWEGEFKAIDALIEKNFYNVKMNVINKDGPVLELIWKIYLDKNKNFKILDVNIDGVSMLVTQRAEFMSVIKNNPNGVIGLIEAMKKKISI